MTQSKLFRKGLSLILESNRSTAFVGDQGIGIQPAEPPMLIHRRLKWFQKAYPPAEAKRSTFRRSCFTTQVICPDKVKRIRERHSLTLTSRQVPVRLSLVPGVDVAPPQAQQGLPLVAAAATATARAGSLSATGCSCTGANNGPTSPLTQV